MRALETTITLSSRERYGRRVPPGAFGSFLENVGPVTRQSVQMVFQRRSTGAGRPPAWLYAASDIRFVGHREIEGGDTALIFEAPTFGEAAGELYRQHELWPQRPSPEDTAFDAFVDVLAAVAAEDRDSDRFDSYLLNTIASFDRSLADGFQSASVHPTRRDRPMVLDSRTISVARSMKASAPQPRQVRVVGRLDMIRASTHTFAIKLEDGAEINGVLSAGNIRDLASLLDSQVLVRGRVIYKPSGRPLRLDAEAVEEATGETELWSRLPSPRLVGRGLSQLRRPQGPRSGIAAVIGKWPGDETDEQIAEALELIS